MIEILLTLFDLFANILTLGLWGKIQGEKTVGNYYENDSGYSYHQPLDSDEAGY